MAPLAMAAVRIWSARQSVAGGAAGRQAAWAVSLTGSRTVRWPKSATRSRPSCLRSVAWQKSATNLYFFHGIEY